MKKKSAAKALTRETPAKVLGWLIASLSCMAFLFAVTATDASFSGTQAKAYDPFAPQKVVLAIDKTAAGFSQFAQENFIKPLAADYKIYADNAVWVFKESGLAYALGVDNLLEGADQAPSTMGQVAGISTSKQPIYLAGGVGIDDLYSILIR